MPAGDLALVENAVRARRHHRLFETAVDEQVGHRRAGRGGARVGRRFDRVGDPVRADAAVDHAVAVRVEGAKARFARVCQPVAVAVDVDLVAPAVAVDIGGRSALGVVENAVVVVVEIDGVVLAVAVAVGCDRRGRDEEHH